MKMRTIMTRDEIIRACKRALIDADARPRPLFQGCEIEYDSTPLSWHKLVQINVSYQRLGLLGPP